MVDSSSNELLKEELKKELKKKKQSLGSFVVHVPVGSLVLHEPIASCKPRFAFIFSDFM